MLKGKVGPYDLLLSTGWKLVSFLLSKPVANSIWGTVHEPKSPIADEDEAAVVEEAAAAVVDTAATFEAAAVAVLPVPATGLP